MALGDRIDPADLQALTEREEQELQQLLAHAPVWSPDANNAPQQMAYESEADVLGYGGAAGGGKTDLICGLALTRHDVVQIFRRDGTELQAIVDRVAAILGSRDGLSGRPPIWRNPTSTCSLIEFCSVPNLGDETKYQGRAKDLLAIDEATNFPERVVRFLMGWVRSATGHRCQTVLTFNPPTTVEGRWVLRFFAPWLDRKHPNPAKPGELRWFTTINEVDLEVPDGRPFVLGPDGEHVYEIPEGTAEADILRPQSRTFVPARVADNRYLTRTPQYIATLQAMPEPFRSLMLHGDFAAAVEDDPFQVIPTRWVEAAMARWKDEPRKPAMDSLGVDVALGGRDRTVLIARHDWWFGKPIVYPGTECRDDAVVAGYIFAALRDEAVTHIDLFGVGAKPYGRLMAAGLQVVGVNMGDPAGSTDVTGRLVFADLRSYLWWAMRDALDPNAKVQLALPPDRALLADLCAPKWEAPRGRIKVQSRDEIVATLGRSPDYGTAAILALMHTVKEGTVVERMLGRRRGTSARQNYDPFNRP